MIQMMKKTRWVIDGLPTLPASYRAGKERKTYLLCVLTKEIVMLGTKETVRASEGLLPKSLTIWVDPDYLGRLAKPLINQHKASSPGHV